MITIEKNVRPEEVRQGARHVLFVEGKDDQAIDPLVLNTFLINAGNAIRVEPLGPSFHIRSAAAALYRYHPDYYFLIDRDHFDDAFVQKCWDKFPDPDTSNLLIWYRRELENYFIIPEYILKSQYLAVSEDELRQSILGCCRRRLFFDAANQVIIWIREEFKKNWIELFKTMDNVKTKDDALNKLIEMPEFTNKKDVVSKQLEKEKISRMFLEILDRLTGGKEEIDYGCGQWLQLLRGKEVLPTIAHKCFRVEDASGRILQGSGKINEMVKDLVRKPLEDQPEDFQKLHRVINERVKTR